LLILNYLYGQQKAATNFEPKQNFAELLEVPFSVVIAVFFVLTALNLSLFSEEVKQNQELKLLQ